MAVSGVGGGVARAEVGFDHAAVVDDVARRALGNQLAVVENHKTVRDRQHHLHQVFDHDDGDALLGDLADDVQRIVYLGGFVPEEGELSEHLTSRAEVAEALSIEGGPEVVWLGAAMIIGAGSTSFEMLRYVTDRFLVCLLYTSPSPRD